MKKNIKYVFLIIGFAIIVISSADVISIIASLLENILNIRLNVVFLSSFLFRAVLMLIGGAFLFIGGIMLKKRKVND
ncbi:hypothetical protein [Longicatena caecimuris]|uniref:hypothetical protein n=1 Tax=Longicatena caecimuris TaxID=1796635 RepID=UPI0018A9B4D8|nr:hypothetical protein [Longicatena caecimuris]